MMAEHILYTIAIILIVGIFYTRFTGKQYYWQILLIGSFLADIDHLNNVLWDAGIVPWTVQVFPLLKLGNFHNVMWMVLLSVCVASILINFKVSFKEGLMFCLAGYGIHLLEDFISYPPVYQMLYPFTDKYLGINIIPETKNLVWAGTEVLEVGIVFLAMAIGLYYFYNSKNILSATKEDD